MILLRHGQTVFNVVFGSTRVDPGIEDPHLTDEGRIQASGAGAALRDGGVTRLVTSPYTRALQTAEIIAGILDVPVSVDALARERSAFACDIGTRRSDLAREWARLGFDHIDEIWWTAPEEHPDDFTSRCRRFRDTMAGCHDWPSVAVVTHWGVIRELTGQRIQNGELLRCDPTQGGPGAALVRPDNPC